jgi:outer membrane receptor protein involved in Fe transport
VRTRQSVAAQTDFARKAAAILAAFAMLPAVAAAQRDSAQRRDSAGVMLAPVQVRASIIPTAGPAIGSGVPARVLVLTSDRIDDWKPRLLPDVLATQPGISLYDELGTPWKLNLSTRGFTAGPTVGQAPGLTVFLDGVRQNEPNAQEVNFDLLPLEHVARVELLAGSASLLGPNSLGGAINLVTARGDGPPSGDVEISGGSFGHASWGGRMEGRTSGGIDFFVGGGSERERGWREATGARNYNAFVNVGGTDPTRGLTLQAYRAQSRAETAGSLPASIFETAPRSNFTAGDFEDLNAQQLALSIFAPVAAGRSGLSMYVRRSDAERFNVNQAPDPDVRSRTSNLTMGASVDWHRVFLAGAGTLGLRLGADGAGNRVHARIYAETAAGEVDDQVHDVGDDEPLGLTTDVKSPSVELAAFGLADYRVGRVTISGGGRYDFVRVPFHNQIRTSDHTTNNYRHVSPRVGVSVQLWQEASLYASAGRSFRAPAILELGCSDPDAACPLPFALGDDPPLQPVRATTYEAGGQWALGALAATVSAYRTDVRDEIFFVASEESLLSGYFRNLDRTRREGMELGLEGSAAGDRLVWYGNYAWTRATFQSAAQLFSARDDDDFAGSPWEGDNDVAPGNRLPLVPDHQVKAGAHLRLRGGVSLGIDARYTGRQWFRGDEANVTSPLSAYTVANARLGYARGGWEVVGIVTNMFETRRATFGTFNVNRQIGALERFLTPVDGRAVKITLQRAIGRPVDAVDDR